SPATAAGDDGALSPAQGESPRRVSADGGAGGDLLCLVPGPVPVRRPAERAGSLLRPDADLAPSAGGPRPPELQPGRTRPDLRAAHPHGNLDVRAAEDGADDGRPAPGEDDAVHALRLHVHVPERGLRAGAVLVSLQRAPDPPAGVHGPAPGAEGSRA